MSDANSYGNDPRCDKCGAEITTGLMAVFCPRGKECEFWVPEVEEFKAIHNATSQQGEKT